MAEKTQLYDIREHNYPNQRGDHFRSLQVFECDICGAITNVVMLGGWPSLGLRTACPHSGKCWHHELQITIEDLENGPYRGYEEDFKLILQKLRDQLRDEIKNDLIGNPDLNLKSSVTHTFSMKTGHDCPHGFFNDMERHKRRLINLSKYYKKPR